MASTDPPHNVEATERTPLLPTTTTDETPDTTSTKKSFSLPSRRTTLLSIFALLVLITSIVLPIVYFVYIPKRLREALNGNNADLKEAHIIAIQNDSVVVRIRAIAHNDEIPPVEVTMQPTLFSFLNVQSGVVQSGDVSGESDQLIINIGSLLFPGLTVPKGREDVSMDFVTAFEHLNVPFVQQFVRKLVKGGDKPISPQIFRMQASPVLSLQRIGSWVVPMQNNVVFDKDQSTGPDPSEFNITATDKQVDRVELSNGLIQFKVSVKLDFNNPTPLSFAAQNMSIHFSVHYEDNRIVDVTIPSSTQLVLGHNTDATVSALTVPEGTAKLMELVGKYADGQNTTVLIKDFTLEFEEGRERLPWVEDILGELKFEVQVPGAQDEDEDSQWLKALAFPAITKPKDSKTSVRRTPLSRRAIDYDCRGARARVGLR